MNVIEHMRQEVYPPLVSGQILATVKMVSMVILFDIHEFPHPHLKFWQNPDLQKNIDPKHCFFQMSNETFNSYCYFLIVQTTFLNQGFSQFFQETLFKPQTFLRIYRAYYCNLGLDCKRKEKQIDKNKEDTKLIPGRLEYPSPQYFRQCEQVAGDKEQHFLRYGTNSQNIYYLF